MLLTKRKWDFTLVHLVLVNGKEKKICQKWSTKADLLKSNHNEGKDNVIHSQWPLQDDKNPFPCVTLASCFSTATADGPLKATYSHPGLFKKLLICWQPIKAVLLRTDQWGGQARWALNQSRQAILILSIIMRKCHSGLRCILFMTCSQRAGGGHLSVKWEWRLVVQLWRSIMD